MDKLNWALAVDVILLVSDCSRRGIQAVGRIARLHRLSVNVEVEGQPVPESIQVFLKGGFFLGFHNGVTTSKSLYALFLREVRVGFLTRNSSPLT